MPSEEPKAVVLLTREERHQLIKCIDKYLARAFKSLEQCLAERQSECDEPLEIVYIDEETEIDEDLLDDEDGNKIIMFQGKTAIFDETIQGIRDRVELIIDEFMYSILLLTQDELYQLHSMIGVVFSEYMRIQREKDEVAERNPTEYVEPADDEYSTSRELIYVDLLYGKTERAMSVFNKSLGRGK
jgi:hypothetical protein